MQDPVAYTVYCKANNPDLFVDPDLSPLYLDLGPAPDPDTNLISDI
jgi:hypothetical protein